MEGRFKICLLITALLSGVARGQSSRNETKIDAGNGLDRGNWGPVALCPVNTWASTMEFKYEPRSNVDDTCGNGVKLYCYDQSGFMSAYVTSAVGDDGEWLGFRRCPTGQFFIGYAMKVEGLVGNFDDDLGVIDVRMECDSGFIVDGIEPSINTTQVSERRLLKSEDGKIQREGVKILRQKLTKEDYIKLIKNRDLQKLKMPLEGEDGVWGPLASCPAGNRICGLQTQVEPVTVATDDAGLCNVVMFCCPYTPAQRKV